MLPLYKFINANADIQLNSKHNKLKLKHYWLYLTRWETLVKTLIFQLNIPSTIYRIK